MQHTVLLIALTLTASCSQAQPDNAAVKNAKPVKVKEPKYKHTKQVPGLYDIGSLLGKVPESSGVAPADQPGTYYSFGDDGNSPTIYKLSTVAKLLGKIDLGTENIDWESLSRDPAGNYFIGDCGNNNSDRQNLRILRFRPEQPDKVTQIAFSYPDQKKFPPKKKERNFDCEASLWHDGQVWLFTKDRGQQRTSNVYTVPDQPGTYTAKYVTGIPIPGEVTDVALAPSGRKMVLLGRGELFVLEGTTWDLLLHDTPRRIGLADIGQTEGVTFKTENSLIITTEKGGWYEYIFDYKPH